MPSLDKSNWIGKDASIQREIVVKPSTMKDLCKLYEVSSKTIHRWLAPFKDL